MDKKLMSVKEMSDLGNKFFMELSDLSFKYMKQGLPFELILGGVTMWKFANQQMIVDKVTARLEAAKAAAGYIS